MCQHFLHWVLESGSCPEGTLHGAKQGPASMAWRPQEGSHTLKSHLDYQGGAEAGANGPMGPGASPAAATYLYPCLRIFEAWTEHLLLKTCKPDSRWLPSAFPVSPIFNKVQSLTSLVLHKPLEFGQGLGGSLRESRINGD